MFLTVVNQGNLLYKLSFQMHWKSRYRAVAAYGDERVAVSY